MQRKVTITLKSAHWASPCSGAWPRRLRSVRTQLPSSAERIMEIKLPIVEERYFSESIDNILPYQRGTAHPRLAPRPTRPRPAPFTPNRLQIEPLWQFPACQPPALRMRSLKASKNILRLRLHPRCHDLSAVSHPHSVSPPTIPYCQEVCSKFTMKSQVPIEELCQILMLDHQIPWGNSVD